MILPAHLDGGVPSQYLARLVDPAFTSEHFAGDYQSLSARTAFNQTTRDKKKIGANLAQAAADKSSEAVLRHAPWLANSARNNRLFNA